ncbi:hypothetical protein NMJ47_004265 [Clostridioides difficile]|nr:hypothetical protein [Clostridioides difficile]
MSNTFLPDSSVKYLYPPITSALFGITFPIVVPPCIAHACTTHCSSTLI